MKHRVEIDVSFVNEQDAKSLLRLSEEIKSKAYSDDETKPLFIKRMGKYTYCGHDEVPPQPCSGYLYVDFANPDPAVWNYDNGGVSTEAKLYDILPTTTKQTIFKNLIDIANMPAKADLTADQLAAIQAQYA